MIYFGRKKEMSKSSMPVKLLANGAVNRSGESLITTEMWGKTHVQSMS